MFFQIWIFYWFYYRRVKAIKKTLGTSSHERVSRALTVQQYDKTFTGIFLFIIGKPTFTIHKFYTQTNELLHILGIFNRNVVKAIDNLVIIGQLPYRIK